MILPSPFARERLAETLYAGGPQWNVPVIYLGIIRLEDGAEVEDGKYFEPTGKRDYKRVLWAGKKSFLPGRIFNQTKMEFRAKENWGRITHCCFFDNDYGGHPITYSPLKRPVEMEEDSIFLWEPGKFVINYGSKVETK